jgi:hypothetical protein
MKLLIRVISDLNELHEIEGAWNVSISKCSRNPFLLSGFVKQFMESNRSRGWTPLLLVISTDNKIIGISPLKTKKKFGVRFAKFLPKSSFSPDFIGDDQYKEIYIAHTLDFLFKTLHCQFVDLTLPAESPNLRTIKQKCQANRTHFFTTSGIGHRILPIECTWAEFEKFRGGNFRRKFKKIEQHLDSIGLWRITCIEKENEEMDITKKVLDVERMSWKEGRRTQRGIKIDPDLMMVWAGSQYMAKTEPDFKWSVWLLELNDQTLAYLLACQYKEVAYFTKTSYDGRYKRFTPGIYICNAAIRELFNKHRIRKVDFLTDLPFMETWTSLCSPRVRIVMSRKRVPHAIIKFVLSSKSIKGILTLLSKSALSIIDFD